MQLKEYMILIVENIFDGVTTLQTKYNSEHQQTNKPIVSPSQTNSEQNICFVNNVGYCINTINFDVAMIAEESTLNEKGGGVSLNIARVKANHTNDSSSTISQRVTFPLHVVYPSVTTKSEPDRVTLGEAVIFNN